MVIYIFEKDLECSVPINKFTETQIAIHSLMLLYLIGNAFYFKDGICSLLGCCCCVGIPALVIYIIIAVETAKDHSCQKGMYIWLVTDCIIFLFLIFEVIFMFIQLCRKKELHTKHFTNL